MDAGFGSWLFAMSVGASTLGGMLGHGQRHLHCAHPHPVRRCGPSHGHRRKHRLGDRVLLRQRCIGFLEGGLTMAFASPSCWRPATTLGALTGVFFVGLASVPFLYGLFAVVLLVSAHQMLARRSDPAGTSIADRAGAGNWADKLRLHASYPDHLLGRSVTYQVRQLPQGMFLMYGAGMMPTLPRIGSGVLEIPAPWTQPSACLSSRCPQQPRIS